MLSCLSEQTGPGGVQSVCVHNLSGWSWTVKHRQCQNTQHPTQSEPAPRGRHLVTAQREYSSAFGHWDTPLFLSFRRQIPELSCANGNWKVVRLCSQQLELGRKRHAKPRIWKLLGSRQGRGCALGAPGTLQGTLVPYNSLLPRQCLPTASLGPQCCRRILAWPTGRADRKPTPRTGQLSLRCCDRCGAREAVLAIRSLTCTANSTYS